jgi:hypothetical protein
MGAWLTGAGGAAAAAAGSTPAVRDPLRQIALRIQQAPAVVIRTPSLAQTALSNASFNFSARFAEFSDRALNQAMKPAQRELLRQWFGQANDVFNVGAMPSGLTLETLQIYHELSRRALTQTGDLIQAGRLSLIEEAIRTWGAR